MFGFVYPLGTNAVFTLTAGSQFDQNWSVESRDSVDVGGESVGFTDTFFRMGPSRRSRWDGPDAGLQLLR